MNKNTVIFKNDLLGECYHKYTHASGLDVYIFPKRTSTVYALFGVKYGAIHNSFTTHGASVVTVPDGIAHFLEHKLFFNEDGSDSFEKFSELGADANAYTSFNKTAYLFSCTENFASSLEELISFVTHPYFTEDSVASEIGIISEEIKMYDDNPGDRCFYGMLEGMYENHSIRKNICGSESSIKKITADTLYDCYNSFYRPDNMVLVICGDVLPEDVKKIVDDSVPPHFVGKAVGKINDNEKQKARVFCEYTEQRMQVSKPIFCIGFKDTDIPNDPRDRQQKDAAMSILNEMLFSRSGDLYSSLFERNLISPATSYGYTITESFAYNSLSGEADDPKAVLDEVLSYLKKVSSEGLDRASFERAKRVMYSEFIRLFDSTESISNTLFSFLTEDAEPFEYADILADVRFEELARLFDRFFSAPSVTLSVVNPL